MNDTLVLFNSSPSLDELLLSTAIREDLEENLEPEHLLLIVHETAFEATRDILRSSPYIDQVLDRMRAGVRMSLIAFDGLGLETQRDTLRAGDQLSDLPLHDVIRPCLTDIFLRRKGFVESSPNYHFKNPSGKHTTRFLRLSNMISNAAEISFMAFAALPAIPELCELVYTDTPSSFPIMAGVNQHRRDSGLSFVSTENFSSYELLESQEELSATNTVILISASSSGSLGRRIADELGYPSEQIWHMLYNGPEPVVRAIANLNFDARLNSAGIRDVSPDFREGECGHCNAGSYAIPLYGDQFELPGPQLDALQLTRADEPLGLRRLMNKYAGENVFGVGMGARQSGFARQYNINVPALVLLPAFEADFEFILRRTLPRAGRAVIYLDRPSLELATLAQTRLAGEQAIPIQLLSRDHLHDLPHSNDPIVVVAAAVESGRSLLDLSRDLRSFAAQSPIIYLIAMSKSDGSPRRDELENNLAMTDHPARHEVVVCDRMLLPVSSEGHAWHRERELLARLRSAGSVEPAIRSWVTKRIDTLSNESSILVDDLFWGNAKDRQLRVQTGFVYADRASVDRYTQADVYFTISSVLQKLRAASPVRPGARAIRSNWFQQTLLSPGNFGRFNDGAIQASILRAAHPRELNFSGDEALSREAGRIISRIVAHAGEDRGEGAAEFLIAIATQTLLLMESDLQAVVDAVPVKLPRLRLLKAACRSVQRLS